MVMNIDPILLVFVQLILFVLIIATILKYFKQTHVIAYIITGILIGPYGLGFIKDEVMLSRLGSVGVMFLLFFIGMEVSLKNLSTKWKIAVLGTLFQIIVSIGAVWLVGLIFNWPFKRIILLGFVISLSSTAVVLKILQDWRELNTSTGQNILSILLMQDIIVVPMLIILSFLSGDTPSKIQLSIQIIGGILVMLFFAFLIKKETLHLPFRKIIKFDHEIQVFIALLICFGFSILTAMIGLSTAFGAFIGGIIVKAAKETEWVHQSLHSFRIIFVALFFVSIGMLIDIGFVVEYAIMLFMMLFAVFVTNTFINAIILRFLKSSWCESLYSGALLSQIGEFSFILAAVGLQGGIINEFGYQTAVVIISLTLLFSPFWISLMKKITKVHICVK